MKDTLALVAASAFFAAVALWLFVSPHTFYATIPGVAASGPFNVHFLRDVAIAYAILAIGLGIAVARRAFARSATSASAAYLVGHAILHLASGLTPSEVSGIVVPALALGALAFRFR